MADETKTLTPVQKVDNVRKLLDRMTPQLAKALPRHLSAERMARIALTSCLRVPQLLDADQATFAGALLTCAQLGLEPDGREAYLIPFRNRKKGTIEVQVIPDYRGLVKLARQSKEIKSCDWRAVRVGDVFDYEYGSAAFLKHRPADADTWTRDAEGNWVEARELTHCYALAVLTSGEVLFEVMRAADIAHHRDRYSRASGDGPWVTNFPEMGAKTCVRLLSKRLPYSTELLRAVELDERAERGEPQDLGVAFTAEAVTTGNGQAEPAAPPSKLDALADRLEAQRPSGAARPAAHDPRCLKPDEHVDWHDGPCPVAPSSSVETPSAAPPIPAASKDPGEEVREGGLFAAPPAAAPAPAKAALVSAEDLSVTPLRKRYFDQIVQVAGLRKLSPAVVDAEAKALTGTTDLNKITDVALEILVRRLNDKGPKA